MEDDAIGWDGGADLANLLSGRQLEALTQQTGLPYSKPVSPLENIDIFET